MYAAAARPSRSSGASAAGGNQAGHCASKNGADPSLPFFVLAGMTGARQWASAGTPARLSVAAVAALTSLAPRVGCARRVLLEVAAAVLAAFPAGFGSTLGVFCKIAFTASMFGHGYYSRGNVREMNR